MESIRTTHGGVSLHLVATAKRPASQDDPAQPQEVKDDRGSWIVPRGDGGYRRVSKRDEIKDANAEIRDRREKRQKEEAETVGLPYSELKKRFDETTGYRSKRR